ncbi:hypothetical protein Nepgr_031972 [Nepenthes gracilis]|uniref:Uncharacterized protein n=1 Tax=Nepenthes gracilis TaxID=150966 RepID=A0AAD3TJ41_NEPGR|nr:hypothetical protein Nepgr_031972 [Nepenthes gracilis]
MPRNERKMEGIQADTTKIRKRDCSPASSSSSVVQNYRFKRAIFGGKRGGGGSTTPVPNWRMVSSRSPAVKLRLAAVDSSPAHPPSHSGRLSQQQPVSARKLAATLWELNEAPSPGVRREDFIERRMQKDEWKRRDGVRRSVHSGSLPPHLSDPSHSPVSERMDRSRTNSYQRRESSILRRLKITGPSIGVLDSACNASFMENKTRLRCHTPTGSTVGGRSQLKDVSKVLTTLKELLTIIGHKRAHEYQPSSSMFIVSALHTELERARSMVKQLIHEQGSKQIEINCLLKHFADEKAAWKSRERETVESAIEFVAGKLKVERKLRRQVESLNKKLGRELTEIKASFLKTTKELEDEKRKAEEMKREFMKMYEEVEKEREMLLVADALREERAQMKLLEAKHQFEEKNAAIDKLRNELETSLRGKGKGINCTNHSFQAIGGDDSSESDLHSIDLNADKFNKNLKLLRNSEKTSIQEELMGQNSTSSKASREGTMLLRSAPEIVLDCRRVPEPQEASSKKSKKIERRRAPSVKLIIQHLSKALFDEFTAGFGTSLLRGYVGEGEVRADGEESGTSGHAGDRQRHLPARRWVSP